MKLMKIRLRSKPFAAAVILLVLVIITLVAVIGRTWASYPANHTLTYKTNQLSWDSGTTVRSDGSAELTVFRKSYENVKSLDGDKLVAPGTSGSDSIVLRNTVDRGITYTAVAYYIKNDMRIPVEMTFDGTGITDTAAYPLPAGVDESNVLRAVSGTLGANAEQAFNFKWDWAFEDGDLASDLLDTALGDDAAAGEDESVKVGFYLVVEDNGPSGSNTVTPVKTGDGYGVWLYVSLAAACLLVLFLLLFTERKKDKEGCR